MKGWLLVNLFLFGIAAIGGGVIFLVFSIVKALHLDSDAEPFGFAIAVPIALFATYYLCKALHALIQKRM